MLTQVQSKPFLFGRWVFNNVSDGVGEYFDLIELMVLQWMLIKVHPNLELFVDDRLKFADGWDCFAFEFAEFPGWKYTSIGEGGMALGVGFED